MSKNIDTVLSFNEFMDNKTLFYTKIEFETIQKSWKILSNHMKLPYVIHIVGTNGKGTTGRFIASSLFQQNQKVIHFTSPHILKFNERIWINGVYVDDTTLDIAHKKITKILPSALLNKLTYFEYSTIIALYLSDGFDFIVLEAGLGGEFDATNVVKNNLTVVPSIGLDHQDFLGDTIVKIASTKLRSCDENYIFGENILHEVLELKKTILKDKNEIPLRYDLVYKDGESFPKYIKSNALLALSVIDYLGFYQDDLVLEVLEGRCQKISKNITIDVGHNPLAANVILEEFKNKKISLVYNCYKDKDYREILSILKPIADEILIIKCDDDRIIDENILYSYIKSISIKVDYFDFSKLDDSKTYLIFGSFKVVETFLSTFRKNFPNRPNILSNL